MKEIPRFAWKDKDFSEFAIDMDTRYGKLEGSEVQVDIYIIRNLNSNRIEIRV